MSRATADPQPVIDERAPDMLFALEAGGAKRCRLCGEVYGRGSQAYHSHAARHVRAGVAEPVTGRRFRRWYRMTLAAPIGAT